MSRNTHDRLITQAALGEFCDCLMPQIVEAETMERAFLRL